MEESPKKSFLFSQKKKSSWEESVSQKFATYNLVVQM